MSETIRYLSWAIPNATIGVLGHFTGNDYILGISIWVAIFMSRRYTHYLSTKLGLEVKA